MNTPTPRPIDLRDFWLSKRGAIVVLGIILLYPVVSILRPTYTRCGSAQIQVTSNGSSYNIRAGLDTAHLLGRTLSAEDLVARLEQRRASFRPNPEPWLTHYRYDRDTHELKLAADVLIKIGHPQALECLVGLLEDPLFGRHAIECLVRLGDPGACPFLLESWRKRPRSWEIFIPAFKKLPLEAAVPALIDALDFHMLSQGPEPVLSAIEKMTGESLREIRARCLSKMDVLHRKKGIDALKADLRQWWSTHLEGC